MLMIVKSIIGITFCGLFLSCLVTADSAFAQSKTQGKSGKFSRTSKSSQQTFEDLKTSYLRLRNTDPQAAQIEQWTELIDQLESFGSGGISLNGRDSEDHVKCAQPRYCAQALLWAAIGNEMLAAGTQREVFLIRAEAALEQISNLYPDSEISDDALLKLADIVLRTRSDQQAAVGILQRIVQAYPSSDVLAQAKARLVELKSESGGQKFTGNNGLPGKEELPRKLPGEFVVVIDPGHGGEDFGAEGYAGILEKDVVLAIALELEKLLVSGLNARVLMTRRSDRFVPLVERTSLANRAQADIFISLHTNASQRRDLSGFEVYYLDLKGDEASRLLVERENKYARTIATGIAAGEDFAAENQELEDLQFIVGDLIQSGKLEESRHLGEFVEHGLFEQLKPKHPFVKSLGVKRAPFFVLVGAHMPCLLVELFFVDHQADGKYLGMKEFRHEIARGLYRGIAEYMRHVTG